MRMGGYSIFDTITSDDLITAFLCNKIKSRRKYGIVSLHHRKAYAPRNAR